MTTSPVRFGKPPVVEVVFGVLYDPAPPLMSAHVGGFWQRVSGDFPGIQDAAPLNPVIEAPLGEDALFSFDFGNLPPLRRTLMVAADGKTLLQVQGDRFLVNWKRATGSDHNRSYDANIVMFERYLAEYTDFLVSIGNQDRPRWRGWSTGILGPPYQAGCARL